MSHSHSTFIATALRMSFGVGTLCVLGGQVWAAQLPVVEFDVPQTVSCRVVSSDGIKSRPNANIMEVVFEVSTRLLAGKESDLKYINYEIVSPERELSIAGFLPSTTMMCETADGIINFEEHRSPAEINIEYAGSMAKIKAPLRTPTDTKVVIKKLAPKSLVMSSGTIDRAHGVYFRLHPSEQDSLQRAQQFVCYLEVPAGFRADYMQVTCNAVSRDRDLGRPSTAEVSTGFAKFNVGLYLEGDIEAKLAADHWADCQQQLNEAVAAYQSVAVKESATDRSSSNPFAVVLHVVRKEPTSGPKSRSNSKAKVASEVDLVQATVTDAQNALKSARHTLRSMNGATEIARK